MKKCQVLEKMPEQLPELLVEELEHFIEAPSVPSAIMMILSVGIQLLITLVSRLCTMVRELIIRRELPPDSCDDHKINISEQNGEEEIRVCNEVSGSCSSSGSSESSRQA
jgi:hypothetical protein